MNLDPELVRHAIARNDAAGVRDLLRDATEADRRACARALRALLHDDPALLEGLLNRQVVVMDLPGFVARLPDLMSGTWSPDEREKTPEEAEHEEIVGLRQGAAFLAAALGLVGGVAQAARAAQDYPSYRGTSDAELDAVTGVLADRNPPWLADFIDRQLELQARYALGMPAWPVARRLARLGVIERPAVPSYTTLMPRGLCLRIDEGGQRGLHATPAEALLADPGLLDEEVWRLFTVPDAAVALQRQGGWAPGLVMLAANGHLDRDRLIDACLGAFFRDFAPTRVDWYAQLHQHLELSIQEMSARADTYMALLGVSSTCGIRLGQQVTALLLDNGLLDVSQFLAASAPPLTHPRKNITASRGRERAARACPRSIRARDAVHPAHGGCRRSACCRAHARGGGQAVPSPRGAASRIGRSAAATRPGKGRSRLLRPVQRYRSCGRRRLRGPGLGRRLDRPRRSVATRHVRHPGEHPPLG